MTDLPIYPHEPAPGPSRGRGRVIPKVSPEEFVTNVRSRVTQILSGSLQIAREMSDDPAVPTAEGYEWMVAADEISSMLGGLDR